MRGSLLKLIVSGAVALGAVAVVATTSVPCAPPTRRPWACGSRSMRTPGSPRAGSSIVESNGVYEGNIVKIFQKPGEDENWRCHKCEGAEKGAPVLGLALIKGMKRNGMSYEDGTIMDPRDGIDLPRVDEAQPGWPEARGAGLSRHFAVRPQPGLEPAARQRARTADRAGSRRARKAQRDKKVNSGGGLSARCASREIDDAGLAVLGAATASRLPVALQASAVTGASPGRRASTSAPSSRRTSSTRPSA